MTTVPWDPSLFIFDNFLRYLRQLYTLQQVRQFNTISKEKESINSKNSKKLSLNCTGRCAIRNERKTKQECSTLICNLLFSVAEFLFRLLVFVSVELRPWAFVPVMLILCVQWSFLLGSILTTVVNFL